jgi:hypothetical protein
VAKRHSSLTRSHSDLTSLEFPAKSRLINRFMCDFPMPEGNVTSDLSLNKYLLKGGSERVDMRVDNEHGLMNSCCSDLSRPEGKQLCHSLLPNCRGHSHEGTGSGYRDLVAIVRIGTFLHLTLL